MTEFLAALALFLAAHIAPSIAPVRRGLVAQLGERRYLAAYSLLSVLLLAWVIIALLRAPSVHLWTPPGEAFRLAVVLMPPAFILVAAGLMAPNPLSVSLSTRDFDPDKPGIVGVTRHPALWGFGLWSAAHASVNGAFAHVFLFGGLTLFAFAGMKAVDRRRRKRLGEEEWRRLARQFPATPFKALLGGRVKAGGVLTRSTLTGVGVAIAAYFLFLFWAHAALFGRDPLAGVGP